MTGRLEGRVAVVVGAGQTQGETIGNGRAVAVTFSREGARVVLVDRDPTSLAETAELCAGETAQVVADIAADDGPQSVVDGALGAFGAIDVLHNNAGVHESDFTDKLTIDTLPDDVWDKVYEINLRGVWQCTKAAAPYLKESQRGPAIVNASSTGGVMGYPMASAYCATKGGVVQLTKTTAIDLAPRVRCNCYCPAAVDTPMIQKYFDAAEDKEAIEKALIGSHLIPRIGKPEEVAKLVCFLASDDAAWITGAAYLIDGGSLAWRGSNG